MANYPDITEKLAGLKPATFLDEKTELPQSEYIIELSDSAAFIVEQFLSNALLVTQYKKYQENRAAGVSPANSLELAVATIDEQELAYELTKMSKAYGVIGGSIIYDDNCPDIELLTIPNAILLETSLGIDFCIPAETKDSDRWLIANFSPLKLKQKIKDLIENDDLTDELKQWLIDNIDDPDVQEIIKDIIQDLINDGTITDGKGRPIVIPDLPPVIDPPGAGAGGAGVTQSTSGAITYTKICGVPQIIAHKDLTGIRSILVFANLIPVEIGPLALRGAVDSYAQLTFDNYKPRNLVSATFLMVGLATNSLTALIPPATAQTVNYTNAPALAHNGVVDVISTEGEQEIGFNVPINGVEVGQSLTLDIFADSGSLITIGSHASPLRCSDITLQGLVTPVPVLLQVIQSALGNQSGLDLYLTCLEIRSNSAIEYDVPFNITSLGKATANSNATRDNYGIAYAQTVSDGTNNYFRNNNGGDFGIGYVAGLAPSTAYTAKFRTGINGPANSGTHSGTVCHIRIYNGGDYNQGSLLYTSPSVTVTLAEGVEHSIPFTTPAGLDDCETYFIRFVTTYPDVYFIELGVV